MSYWRAGAPQTCKNTVAPIGIVANFLFAPQFDKVWMKRPSGHNETSSWPWMGSYELHPAPPYQAVSPVAVGRAPPL